MLVTRLRTCVAATALTTLALSGCATTDGSWNKQAIGTAIGTIAGTVIGSQVGGGSGRIIATIAGAIAGGALGNWIGASLDEKDKQALALSTEHALTTGQAVQWKSEHSGASATITPVSSTTVTRPAAVKRAPVIAKVSDITMLNEPYRATKSANLRAAPNASSEKVGGFLVGQTFTALGKTSSDWIAVARKGVVVGYVYAPLVAPARTADLAPAATDLDTLDVAQASAQGFDLDTIEPAAPVADQVLAQTTCRTMQYSLQTSSGNQSKTMEACQGADGAWELG